MPVVPAPTSTTTGTNLIDETLRLLHSGQREQQNKLLTASGAGTTSLSFTYDLDGLTPGTIVSIDIEDFWVWATNEGGKTATVEPGHRGSTQAAHAINTLVQVNPRFSKWQVFEAINDEIRSLAGDGLFKMRTVDLTANASVQGYNLTNVTDIKDVYKVQWEATGSAKIWPEARFSFSPDMNTTEFASGYMIQVYDSIPSGQTLRVFYKSGFSVLTQAVDNVETVTGVPESIHDVLTLGAAARLVEPRETRRADMNSQGDSRRAGEVPAGHQLQAGGVLKARRDQRVQAEIRRLQTLWPVRLRV